jgi:hypothetical protein
MSSPLPMDYNDPTCSYCWKDGHKYSKKFRIGNKILWACSKRCEKGLIKIEKELGNKVKDMFGEVRT